MSKTYAVYILTNYNQTTFYVGVTGNLQKRIWEHKNKLAEGFTKKYNVDRLVYYEVTENVETALNREKQLKRWHRDWKINLIREFNPEFKDLYESLQDPETRLTLNGYRLRLHPLLGLFRVTVIRNSTVKYSYQI